MKICRKIYGSPILRTDEKFHYAMSDLISNSDFLDYVQPEKYYRFSYRVYDNYNEYRSWEISEQYLPPCTLLEVEVEQIPIYTSVYKAPEDLHLVNETSFWKKLRNAVAYMKCKSGVYEYKLKDEGQ